MPYKESPYFETPCHTETLWRYMHIDKFMSMINTRSLYFPKITAFKDIHEGALSEESLKGVYETHLLDEKNTPVYQDDIFRSKKEEMEKKPEGPEKQQSLNDHHSFYTLLTTFSNHLMFCRCWLLNDDESHCMWAEYGDKSPTSVAIQTTIGDLIDSMKCTDNIYKRLVYNFDDSLYSDKFNIHIGKIKYKDYDTEHIKGYDNFSKEDLTNPDKVLELFYAPVMHKRNIYEDEHEVRAVISFESICDEYFSKVYTSDIPFYSHEISNMEGGFSYVSKNDDPDKIKKIPNVFEIKTDLHTLINTVVMSPYMNGYFDEPLRKLMDNNKLTGGLVRISRITEVLEKVSFIE